MNEDVDLGLKLGRVGRIVLCPAARMAHFHAPSGRVSAVIGAEDDLYNRYLIIRYTQDRSAVFAAAQVLLYFAVETTSNLIGSILRGDFNGNGARFTGRCRALLKILLGRATP
jgi:GT2 family glycosyltransferase